MTGGPSVELVAVGDELLLGAIIDSNGAWLAGRFAELGIAVTRRTVVGDDDASIRDVVGRALARSRLVVCTGGLGPTRDDVTRPSVTGLMGRRLRVDEAVLDVIRGRFEALGRMMPETNRVQAQVPDGAAVFPNPAGTAPGLALEDDDGGAVVLLPGVPREMREIFEGSVVPWLRERGFDGEGGLRHRTLRATGIPESELAVRLDDAVDEVAPVTVAFLPSVIGVDLRLTSRRDGSGRDAVAALDVAERRIRERMGDDVIVYGRDDEDLADVVGRELAARGLTLAVAESCTAGLVAERLTRSPGASTFLLAGVVAYADEAKVHYLGVDPHTIETHGAVSGETARAMLEGARRSMDTDAAVAVTGIAGPGGGSPAKPVGTVWIAAAVGERVRVHGVRFPGDRVEIRTRSAQAALALLWRLLHDRRYG